MASRKTKTDRKKKETREVRTGMRQAWGVILLVMSLITLLSLASYDWHDISLFSSPASAGGTAHNFFGPAGAWLACILLGLFGVAAYVVPLWLIFFGFLLTFKPDAKLRVRIVSAVGFMIVLSHLMDLHQQSWTRLSNVLNIGNASGGMIVQFVNTHLEHVIGARGIGLLASVLLVVATVFFIGLERVVALAKMAPGLVSAGLGMMKGNADARREQQLALEEEERQLEKKKARLERAVSAQKPGRPAVEKRVKKEVQPPPEKPKPKPRQKPKPAPEKKVEPKRPTTGETPAPDPVSEGDYTLPPISLLDELPPRTSRAIEGDAETTGHVIRDTLEEFGIETEVTNMQQGPVVTRYELLPAPGVRVERIAGLSNNLALALKATSVRVQAPVPGKGVVGVEVPNSTASKVFLREVLEGEEWQSSDAALPLALGKDVGGKEVIADLAKVPHLLIAGATGSGKTVCMNSILVGLLMSRTPDQMRLLLVDPKIVEFSCYNKLPHLIVPVITDPHKVTLGLRWAINEMEKRYKLFARAGVRNIESFNNRTVVKQTDMFSGEEEDDDMPARLPYIVIAVDELADLMLVAQADVENCIARLAQLSRAVGIHMIVATQRPSVNVITGTIKANFPARIAFQVAQRVDSRTILDQNGADKLLGRGDMLFLPAGSNKMIRAQGSMVTDQEAKRVIDFIKEQGKPRFEVEIHDKLQNAKKGSAGSIDTGEDDELLEQAVEIIRETRRASTSSLQRRLRIGYTRAARMMDILEERGVIGPPRGSDPREILIDLDVGMSDEDEDEDDEARREEPTVEEDASEAEVDDTDSEEEL